MEQPRDALDTISCARRWLRHDTNPILGDKTHPVVSPDRAAHRIASTFIPPFPQPRDTAHLQATHIQKTPAQAGTPKSIQCSAMLMSLYHPRSPTQVFTLTGAQNQLGVQQRFLGPAPNHSNITAWDFQTLAGSDSREEISLSGDLQFN